MHNPEPISSQSISLQGEHEDRGQMARDTFPQEERETATELAELLDFAEEVSANIGKLEGLQRRHVIRAVALLLLILAIASSIILLPDALQLISTAPLDTSQLSSAEPSKAIQILLRYARYVGLILYIAFTLLFSESLMVFWRTRKKLVAERELMARLVRTASKRVEERDKSSTRHFILEERLRRLSFRGARWYETGERVT